jgi:Skp family chaperone for outer membrane proteins
MKKLLQNITAAAVVFGLCSFVQTARAADIAQQKIGVVDLQKVFSSYYKTDRSSKALKQEAAEMEKERKEIVDAGKKQEDEWQKLIDKAEDQAASADERAKNKKAAEEKFRDVKSAGQDVQRFDQASAAHLRETERQRHDDIVKEIRSVLNADAKAAGYTLVLDVSGDSANTVPVVLYSTGVNDLTDSLIKELNAGAPVTPPEDKPAAATNAVPADDKTATPATPAPAPADDKTAK